MAIQTGRPAFRLMFIVAALTCVVSKQPQSCPGRDHEGHHQRKQHGCRCSHWNRSHVWAHQAPHKSHGQDGADDGERSKDRGIADLIHCLDSHFREGPPATARQSEVADDVLHHHNGVVYQNADGEDQSKQGDPVERVSIEIKDGQGKG